jgi:hypothetical protein
MSAGQTPPSPARAPDPNEITIVSHSNLFYWWPVWAGGYLMALITLFDNHRMVTVPHDAVLAHAKMVDLGKGDPRRDRAVVMLPGDRFGTEVDKKITEEGPQPPLRHMSRSKNIGVVFAFILLAVIVITNVPLRGMWSVLIIVGFFTVLLILRLAGWLGPLFETLRLLDIRINLGGYITISTVLFVIWLITMLLFDRQIYMIFTPGQLKVCTEIGGGEKVYDAIGMTVEKQRGDIFRHRILGLGSGDLIVKTAGAQAHHFDLPNVLFINKKVQMIEDMLKRRPVIESK